MSTLNPQADLEAVQSGAEPVYETDIWNPLAADGHLQVLHSHTLEPEPLPDSLPESELELEIDMSTPEPVQAEWLGRNAGLVAGPEVHTSLESLTLAPAAEAEAAEPEAEL